jgi:hypothetical protein
MTIEIVGDTPGKPKKESATEESIQPDDFRSGNEHNISDTFREYRTFVDNGTHDACMYGGKIHPASPKKEK